MILLPKAHKDYARIERRGKLRTWLTLALWWLLYGIVTVSLLILLAKVYAG